MARARGARLGGWTAGSEARKREADQLAKRMKPVLIELGHLTSTRQIAAELNRRGIKSATGGQWSSKTVGRLRDRALKRGREASDARVEESLYRNALAGNTTAQIFWLKNRRPSEWRDVQNIEQITGH